MRVYLDNNATTIVDPQVKTAMDPFFCQYYGNPNSLHAFASDTHIDLNNGLEKIYAGINAPKQDSVVVTSCATESNNWVLKSIYFQYILTGRKDHIIVSEVEHPSIIATARYLESLGVKVTYIPINSEGLIEANSILTKTCPSDGIGVSISIIFNNPPASDCTTAFILCGIVPILVFK